MQQSSGGDEAPGFPYRPRRGQLEAARALAETVKRGGVFALSAPTGFGKTIVILYGLLLAGVERAVYLVRTRNELAPVLRELRRLGRGGYVFLYSARRMCPLLRGEGMGLHDFWETCRVLRLSGNCSYYNRVAEVDEETLRAIVEASESPFSAVDALARQGVCPFFALRGLVPGSWLVAATYPYVFKREIFETAFEPLDYSDLVIVVDEAHSLLNASSLGEVRLSTRDMEAAAREAGEHGAGEAVERIERLRELVEWHAPRLGDGLRRLPVEKLRRIMGEPAFWSDLVYEIRLEKLRRALDEGSVSRVRVAVARVEELVYALHLDGYMAYAYRDRGAVGVAALPLDPCVVVGEALGRARAVVLASGTLPPRELLRDSLCLGDRELVYYDVELLHGVERGPRRVVAAVELSSRYTERSPSMYSLYARYILETYRAVRRSMLAVYPSYDFMRTVVEALGGVRGREPLEMIVEDRDTSIDEVAEKASRRKILINAVVGGKLTEGIEVTVGGSSAVGTVFIAGVPYPQPDDYLEDQLARLTARLGPREARVLLYDVTAAIKTRQAVGRAQRGPGDPALIVLGDRRFLRPRLRRLLRLGIDAVATSLEAYREIVAAAAEELGV